MDQIISLIESNVFKKGKVLFDRFRCFCGNAFVARRGNVKRGVTRSCGCLKSKMVSDKNTTHGLRYTNKRIYNIWKAMRQRCSNPNSAGFKYYGAKGVRICQQWSDYANFYDWSIRSQYDDSLTIDRISPFGNYEPDNCRWVSLTEQARNKRETLGWDSVHKIRDNYNEGSSVKELTEVFNVQRSTIKRILNNETYFDEGFVRSRTGRIYHKKPAA